MTAVQLRTVSRVLFVGVAFAGAVTGGYALGAASTKTHARGTEGSGDGRSGDAHEMLRRIERRLASLELRVSSAASSGGGALAVATPDDCRRPAVPNEPAEGPDPSQVEAASDPDALVASERLVDDVLSARRMSEVHEEAFRDTLAKLSMDDRMAVLDELGAAMNRGEIEFDARELF